MWLTMHNVYTAWLAYFFAKVRSHGCAFWSMGEYPIMVSTQPDLRFGLKVLKQNLAYSSVQTLSTIQCV